jgi:glycosyltransferase involved in cell wall biosynthesis
MKVSVVIAMYNAQDSILSCLQALAAQECLPAEVIVVDNNSTDQSKDIVQKAVLSLSKLKIVLCHEIQKGPSATRNKGAALAQGDILAFTDADCIAHPSWIKNIRTAFEKEPSLDAVGGINKLTGQATTTMEKFLLPFWLSPHLTKGIVSKKDDFFAEKFIVPFNCAFKKSFFVSLGGFDASFKTGEDIDITLRAVDKKGHLIAWDPSIMVYHQQRISFKKLLKKVFNYGEGLAHLGQVHFAHQVFIRFPWGYYRMENRLLPPVILMTNVPKMILLVVLLVFMAKVSLVLCLALFVLAAIYFLIKIKRLASASGLHLTLQENLTALWYYIGREIAELLGRIYWSFKYRVICM